MPPTRPNLERKWRGKPMANHTARVCFSAALAFAGSLGASFAQAADLGGDCCADLEERIAQLEATTVQKGNKKVTVTLYGRVNRVVHFWDDGAESNTYTLNSSYSPTRWGFRGDAKIGGAWTAGYNLEMEDNGKDRKSTRLNSSHLGISYAV